MTWTLNLRFPTFLYSCFFSTLLAAGWTGAQQEDGTPAGAIALFEEGEWEQSSEELEIARKLQAVLTPGKIPKIVGFDIAGRCFTAHPVGGNFFRFFQPPDGPLTLVVVDVTGQGMAASAAATIFSGILIREMQRPVPIEKRMDDLNKTLFRLDPATSVCLAMGELDPISGILQLANSGLPHPYHFKADSSEIVEIGADAYPLGMRPDTSFAVTEVQLDPGDYLVLCSDGITGAKNATGEVFGPEQTAKTIRRGCKEGLPAGELVDRLIATVRTFAGDVQPPDDMVCVVFRAGVLTVELPGGETMEMMWIKPGAFAMGIMKTQKRLLQQKKLWIDRFENETPAHQVSISQGFYLGRYEITQRQWDSVMGGNLSQHRGAGRPVDGISWHEVQEFIHRLNKAEGDSLYRLPTEAEWEYACRAGTETPWSFGDDERRLGDYAWYAGNNSPYGTKVVGMKYPNPWGLYDMHGNVWEWCQDGWLRVYERGAWKDPVGPAESAALIIRGGDFGHYAQGTRSTVRSAGLPHENYDYVGARLLRMATPALPPAPDTSNVQVVPPILPSAPDTSRVR